MFHLLKGDEYDPNLYRQFRRPTPEFVVEKVMDFLQVKLPKPHGIAVDVGCGSGQNTMCFAPYFHKVYGFDISQSQVEEAKKDIGRPSNVTFGVSPAETLPVENNSVELVTGGTSFHWFDFEKFHTELDRILVTNGVAAAICHSHQQVVHPVKGTELNALMEDFVSGFLTQKLHPRAHYPLNDYRDLPLAFQDQERIYGMPMDVELTVSDVVGAYASWSSFQTEYKENPQKARDALQEFQTEFLKIMGTSTTAEATPVVVRFNYNLVMCRKNGPVN